MTPNIFKSIVRSITPAVLSAIVWAASYFHYKVNAVTATEVAAILGTLVTIGAHVLETKWKWFGVFLGWLGAPAYDPTVTKAELQAQVAALTAQLDGINAVIASAPGSPAPIA
jgi:hypothetical protein